MTSARYKPSPDTLKSARISPEDYQALYKRSVDDPDSFWGEMAGRIDWFKKTFENQKYILQKTRLDQMV